MNINNHSCIQFLTKVFLCFFVLNILFTPTLTLLTVGMTQTPTALAQSPGEGGTGDGSGEGGASEGGEPTDNQIGENLQKTFDQDGSELGPKWLRNMMAAIGQGILWVGSASALVGGAILDASVGYLVIEVRNTEKSGLLTRKGLEGTIEGAWSSVRDACNLAFIFGLIYIGIRIILGLDSSVQKRLLSNIIIGALLINFSLFFAQVVVDMGNYLSITVHKDGVNSVNIDGAEDGGTGFGALFTHALALSDMYDIVEVGQLSAGQIIAYYFMAFLFVFTAGFVFAIAGLMLVVRFVVLVFIMIGSPIMFAATIFPQTAQYAAKMRNQLFANAFYPVILFFLLFLSLHVVLTIQEILVDGTSKAQALKGGALGSAVISFVVAMFLMVYSLIIANKLSVAGGGFAERTIQGARKRVQSFAGRNTIGLASGFLRKGYESADASMNKTRTGRNVRRAVNTVTLGATSDRVVRGTLLKGENAKFGGQYSYADDVKYQTEHSKRMSDNLEKRDRKKNAKEQLDAITNGNSNQDGGKAVSDAMDDLGKTIRAMSDAERADINIKTLTNENVAIHLTDKHLDGLEKSGEFSYADIQEIKGARKRGFENIAEHGRADGVESEEFTAEHQEKQRRALLSKSSDVVGKLPANIFANENMAPYLQPSMIEARMKEGLSNTELEKIKENITSNFLPTATEADLKKWSNWTEKTTRGSEFGLNVPVNQQQAGQNQGSGANNNNRTGRGLY